MKKINNAINPFFDLINEYVQRGYKLPDLTSERKNIFRRSLLIEAPKYYKEYFEINKLSTKEINELNFLQRFKKNINIMLDIKNNLKKNDKSKTIDTDNESNNLNEFVEILNKIQTKNVPSIPVEKKIQEEEEENKEKERNELTAYNSFIKNLINSVEKDHIKQKINLNKAGFLFPASTQAKRQIKIKFGLSPNKKSNDSPKNDNNNNTSFFNPLHSSVNVRNSLKKKINIKNINSYMSVKKQKNNRHSLPLLNGYNTINLTTSTTLNEQTINSISNSLGEPNGEINDFLKVISKTKRRLLDYDSENIIQYFGECLKFIKGEEKVFVHCAAGESRSATIVIAYLMWKNKMVFDKAYDFVRQKRPRIYPNFGFRQQLQMFEKLLLENGFNISNIYFVTSVSIIF